MTRKRHRESRDLQSREEVNSTACGRPTKPPGIRLVVASYGTNPPYPGMVAHQYTDGSGYGGGLPEGAPPFGSCDMNSADGLTAADFGRACGITVAESAPAPVLL